MSTFTSIRSSLHALLPRATRETHIRSSRRVGSGHVHALPAALKSVLASCLNYKRLKMVTGEGEQRDDSGILRLATPI